NRNEPVKATIVGQWLLPRSTRGPSTAVSTAASRGSNGMPTRGTSKLDMAAVELLLWIHGRGHPGRRQLRPRLGFDFHFRNLRVDEGTSSLFAELLPERDIQRAASAT